MASDQDAGETNRAARILFLVDCPPASAFWRACGILGVWNVILLIVTGMEGTWRIDGEGVGFLEDPVQLASIVGQVFAFWSTSRLLGRVRALREPIERTIVSFGPAEEARDAALTRAQTLLAESDAWMSASTPSSKRAAWGVFTLMCLLVVVFQVVLPWVAPPPAASWVLTPRLHPLGWAVGIVWNLWTFAFVAATALWVTISSATQHFAAAKTLITEGIIRIVPLAPDGRGGVAFLGDLSLAQSFVLGSGIPWLVLWIVVYGAKDVSMWLGAPLYLAVQTVLFFGPLLKISRAMREAKQRDLERFSSLFNVTYLGLDQAESVSQSATQRSGSALSVSELAQIHSLYRMAQDMPVWPFDVQTLRRFVSLIGVPLLAILQQLVSDLPWKKLFVP